MVQKGFALLELLIAIAIFSMGLLALSRLQVFTLKSINRAALISQKIIEKHNQFERNYEKS